MEAVIADTGPLVAFLRRDDADHEWSADRFRELHSPLVTCEAVLSEALFLLNRSPGGVRRLRDLVDRGLVVPAFNLADDPVDLPGVAMQTLNASTESSWPA